MNGKAISESADVAPSLLCIARPLPSAQIRNGGSWRKRKHGRVIQTLAFRELAEAIDDAKRIVNAER
jgi:hypothetical protein